LKEEILKWDGLVIVFYRGSGEETRRRKKGCPGKFISCAVVREDCKVLSNSGFTWGYGTYGKSLVLLGKKGSTTEGNRHCVDQEPSEWTDKKVIRAKTGPLGNGMGGSARNKKREVGLQTIKGGSRGREKKYPWGGAKLL